MHKLEGNYQVWSYEGYGHWGLLEFDTLEQALEHEKYHSDWVITKKVDYEVKVIEE